MDSLINLNILTQINPAFNPQNCLLVEWFIGLLVVATF